MTSPIEDLIREISREQIATHRHGWTEEEAARFIAWLQTPTAEDRAQIRHEIRMQARARKARRGWR